MTTLDLPCKYCCLVSGGGTQFTDFEGVKTRACWKADCQTKYSWEIERIEFRERRALQAKGKCVFKLVDSFCAEPSIAGELYCKTHITKRCNTCGQQATRVCPKIDYFACELALCHDHKHDHHYYH